MNITQSMGVQSLFTSVKKSDCKTCVCDCVRGGGGGGGGGGGEEAGGGAGLLPILNYNCVSVAAFMQENSLNL